MPIKRLTSIFLSIALIASVLGYWHFHPSGPTEVKADSTAARTATASSDCTDNASAGTVTWTSPSNAALADNNSATATVDGTISHYIYCTNFGFTTAMIPAGSTINGFVVGVNRMSNSTGNGGSSDAAVRLVKGGVIGTTDRSTTTVYTTIQVLENHGSSTDLWGDAWTVADVTSSAFGAAVAVQKASAAGSGITVFLEHIEITVSFTPRTMAQSGYRLFSNTDSPDVGAPLAAANSAATLTSAGQAFRLRTLLHINTNQLSSSEKAFKLQYAVRGSDNACDTSFSGETYTELRPLVSASSNVAVSAVDDASIGTEPWTNPGNAATSDNLYATTGVASTKVTHYLVFTGFGFSVPSGATVTGITVEFEELGGGTTAPFKDAAVRLVKGGTIGTIDRSLADTWSSTEVFVAHGGSTDVWGGLVDS